MIERVNLAVETRLLLNHGPSKPGIARFDTTPFNTTAASNLTRHHLGAID